ncbi:MAG TPA: sigma-70 family RNA polymerase sigma factor [Sporichthyaceae bacterium]|jgi:RNA polymerase sigma-B factor|nr:sigma-70 family RNA polymerase sigma factor [Sporichthyaceae bacterium]
MSTCNEETGLFAALRQDDPGRRDFALRTLSTRYEWIVRCAVQRYGGRGETRDDLAQVARLGLLNAITRFDPARGCRFPAYAMPTVTGEIKRHFRDRRRFVQIPRAMQELQLRINQARDRLAQHLCREPRPAELAAELDVPITDVRAALDAFAMFSPIDLDEPMPVTRPWQLRPEPLAVTDQALDRVVDLVALGPAIAALPERDRRILALRFYEDLPQAQIGAALGLSQMHISRLLTGILARLRKDLEAA